MVKTPPAPPRRKAPPPPPQTVKPKAAKRKKQNGATAHVRRVTLNLLRHSACCPDDLRPMLDKLAGPLDWKLDALSDVEKETLYATVDENLANAAKDEFQADLRTAVDHRHNTDEWCKLCGHQHIRFEFDLINTAGGQSTKTGSTCIETYGLNVDGEGTAEQALIALHGAINRLKRVAEKEDWQKAHPEHVAEMDRLRGLYGTLRMNQQPWKLYRFLNDNWNKRCRSMVTRTRAILKYYDREGFLTEKRSAQCYGAEGTTGQGTLVSAAAMTTELSTAQDSYAAVVARWQRFIDACPRMEGWERRRVLTWRDRGIDPESLHAYDKKTLKHLHQRNGSPVIKKETA